MNKNILYFLIFLIPSISFASDNVGISYPSLYERLEQLKKNMADIHSEIATVLESIESQDTSSEFTDEAMKEMNKTLETFTLLLKHAQQEKDSLHETISCLTNYRKNKEQASQYPSTLFIPFVFSQGAQPKELPFSRYSGEGTLYFHAFHNATVFFDAATGIFYSTAASTEK